MLSQNRKATPEEGRKYHIGATVEVTRVDECDPPCVFVKHKDGSRDYVQPKQLDWTDLGPALEEGYYQDSYGHFWHYYPSGEWQRKGPGMVGVVVGNGTARPVFPIYRVKVLDGEIRE